MLQINESKRTILLIMCLLPAQTQSLTLIEFNKGGGKFLGPVADSADYPQIFQVYFCEVQWESVRLSW